MEDKLEKLNFNKVIIGVLALSLIVVLIISSGKNPKLENGEEIAIEVDGYQISANDLYRELVSKHGIAIGIDLIDNFIAEKEIETTDEMTAYVDDTIEMYKEQYEDFDATLLEAGYESEAVFRDLLLLSYKKNIVVENYYKDTITEEEINKYYEEKVTPTMDVRHILIIPEEDENKDADVTNELKEKAREEAIALIKRIDEGEDFAELAKEYSDCSSAPEGGLIEDVSSEGFDPAFVEASVLLKEGEYTSEPVESMYGYHVILKVEDKEKPALEEKKEEIISSLVQLIMTNDENAGFTAWSNVRKDYNLNIYDNTIKSIYDLNK